jgi:hypothetical protein
MNSLFLRFNVISSVFSICFLSFSNAEVSHVSSLGDTFYGVYRDSSSLVVNRVGFDSQHIVPSKLIVKSAFPSLYPHERSKLDARIRFDDDSTSNILSSEVSWSSTNPSLFIENGFASAKNIDSSTRVSINASTYGLSAILFIRLKPESSNISTVLDPSKSIVNALSDSVNMGQAGWKNSNWFGNYFESDGGWIYHQYHGWLFPITQQSSSLWVWSPDQKWLWTNPELYPHIFRHKDGDWLYFIKQAFPRKAYYNQSSKKLEFGD